MAEDKATILVVEDDRSVRQFAANVLRGHGYRVLEAPEGKSAIELVRDDGRNIRLLLCDVVLPGMNGAELARVLRGTYPELKVVFMSGYDEDELEEKGIPDVGAAYITKPFTAQVLTMMVEGALD